MNNQEKLVALKAHLRNSGIEYWENVQYDGKDMPSIPLFLPKGRIAIRIGDDAEWYHKLRNFVHPVIIRDVDTSAFVIEKVENTIKFKSFRKGRKFRRPLTPNQRKRSRRLIAFRKSLVPGTKVCVVIKKNDNDLK